MTDFTVQRYYSDFMLKGLRIKNTHAEDIEVVSLAFTIKCKGKTIKTFSYDQDAIDFWLPSWHDNIIISHPKQRVAWVGASEFWDYSNMASSRYVKADEEIGIRGEYFHIIFDQEIDALIVTVDYKHQGQRVQSSERIKLINYEHKNDYIFPVKGIWQVDGNFDCLLAHRGRHSDEFAIDLTQLDPNHTLVDWPGRIDEDYPCNGAEVLAAADGKVVQAYGEMTENTLQASKEEFEDLAIQHSYWPVITGNVVTIEHAGGEYSQYNHMQHKSLKVKVGDTVKAGDVIGYVGSTGLSGCPHLHFEIRNGITDASRSYPCRFTNIKDKTGKSISIISEEYTTVQTIE